MMDRHLLEQEDLMSVLFMITIKLSNSENVIISIYFLVKVVKKS